jgi:hypothetical protein
VQLVTAPPGLTLPAAQATGAAEAEKHELPMGHGEQADAPALPSVVVPAAHAVQVVAWPLL